MPEVDTALKCRLCGEGGLSMLTGELRDGPGSVYYCPECQPV